jgi:hypothetical protein
MKKLLFYLIVVSLLISNLFSAFTEENTGWTYIQSINQAFYIFISPMDIIDSDGNTIEGYGDGSGGQDSSTSDCGQNPSSCDVLGAFITHDLDEGTCDEVGGYYQNNQCDVCVGWSYYNSYSVTDNGSITSTLLINGFDNSDNGDYDYYCENGEVPHLKYYDASDGIIYALTSDADLGAFSNLAIFLYWPDCEGMGECLEVHFLAAEDDPLSNEDLDEFPNSFEIVNIYPNPFNPSTQIEYALSSVEYINISVYDTIGRHIMTLFEGFQDIGHHDLTWSPESSVSSGSYIIKIETLNDLLTSKVTYLK